MKPARGQQSGRGSSHQALQPPLQVQEGSGSGDLPDPEHWAENTPAGRRCIPSTRQLCAHLAQHSTPVSGGLAMIALPGSQGMAV